MRPQAFGRSMWIGRADWLGRRVLFPLLLSLIALPMLAAFRPLFSGGLASNLGRALAEPRFLKSFGFGLSQALASTGLALAVGLPAAFLIARRSFPGRRLLSALSAIPFSVPALIVAIGFVLYYGRQGYLNQALIRILGLEEGPLSFLYSFYGVVLAHGFYNFPLVMRFVADAWSRVPASQIDAARLLGAGRLRIFRTITLPAIGPAIGSAASLTFLLCFFSFVIIMLFAGPGVATPEVELYRAARFEFDRPLASAFALGESLIALAMLAVYAWFESRLAPPRSELSPAMPPSRFRSWAGRLGAAAFCIILLVVFAGPLVSILIEALTVRGRTYAAGSLGLANFLRLFASPAFRQAAANTLLLGLLSASLAALLGFGLSLLLKASRGALIARVLPMLPLAISSVVLTYGWTSLVGRSSVLVIAMVQAVSTYPFIYKAIQGSLGQADVQYAQAALTLGSSRIGAALRVSLPLALPGLLSGLAFAFAISAGDANALIVAPIAGFDTMASYLYKLAGSYRFNDACAVAVLLAMGTGLIFFLRDYQHELS